MALQRPTLTRQIIFGYLILALFSLSAVSYALFRLRDQAERSRQLLQVDLSLQEQLQSLHDTLLEEERLSLQYLLDQRPGLLVSLGGRLVEAETAFGRLSGREGLSFGQSSRNYLKTAGDFLTFCRQRQLDRAHSLVTGELGALRRNLLQQIERTSRRTGEQTRQTLLAISREGDQTYQVVLILVICGILLAAVTGISLHLYIQNSLQTFARMIRDFGAGSFDIDFDARGNDEFSRLAREMREMGRKLREMEEYQLDASPLTRLPGNLAIRKEIEARIERGEAFAHAFADLDHFKAYNDRYGYQRGSDVISMTGDIIRDVVAELGSEDDMVGHIGGDDYIFLTRPELAERIADEIVRRFDRAIPAYYSEEDRRAGFFIARDRFGEERKFPLLSISIAIVASDNFDHPSATLIGRECARIKEYLKDRPGSCYLLDRRRIH
ncbi:diguanylate cyclase (GGDEF)-like protein [Geothermobacter ehrlichii]|uniref:diguanylate cyclase n=1 Tax=Geothermobacter ehrlichii TaxID=213224 RepID=A0A5D3WK67_9BACT|nr:diguanylate cyclase [Geothermobacter ehrlichii]TYO98300.1 diguanylate cyclase (GGDEF)-like protein [Geothermobacter ehrlichii]